MKQEQVQARARVGRGRATVTATRADGRTTVSRHGTTADAIAHAVELASQTQSNGRGRAYRHCVVSGAVSHQLVGTALVVRRASRREAAALVAGIRARARYSDVRLADGGNRGC